MKPAKQQRDSAGFTLVELAISVMVIGLLLGGVLKGKELIDNSRATAVARQVTAYWAAIRTFQTTYNAFPGDMINPGDRIPGCSGSPCADTGNENGLLEPASAGYHEMLGSHPPVTTGEVRNFFLHLARAGLITGIDLSYTGTPNTFGVDFPSSPAGGGWNPTSNSNVAEANPNNPNWQNYLRLIRDVPGSNNYLLSPIQTSQIDTKIDDGVADTGDVRGYHIYTDSDTATWGCTFTTTPGVYRNSKRKNTCTLYVMIHPK